MATSTNAAGRVAKEFSTADVGDRHLARAVAREARDCEAFSHVNAWSTGVCLFTDTGHGLSLQLVQAIEAAGAVIDDVEVYDDACGGWLAVELEAE